MELRLQLHLSSSPAAFQPIANQAQDDRFVPRSPEHHARTCCLEIWGGLNALDPQSRIRVRGVTGGQDSGGGRWGLHRMNSISGDRAGLAPTAAVWSLYLRPARHRQLPSVGGTSGPASTQEHQQEPPTSGPLPLSLAVPADGTEQQLDERVAAAEPTQDISRVPLKHAQGTEPPMRAL